MTAKNLVFLPALGAIAASSDLSISMLNPNDLRLGQDADVAQLLEEFEQIARFYQEAVQAMQIVTGDPTPQPVRSSADLIVSFQHDFFLTTEPAQSVVVV